VGDEGVNKAVLSAEFAGKVGHLAAMRGTACRNDNWARSALLR